MQVYIPESVIDELISATGFTQVVEDPPYDIKYKCKWLLERIGIMKEAADRVNILHDNPDLEKLVALVKYQELTIEALDNTIQTQLKELYSLRDKQRS